jgi:hypothetical protein
MPYIKQADRQRLAAVLEEMEACEVKPNGELNYICFAYAVRTVEPSYNNWKNYIAELQLCANELKRRYLDPYEDKKILENGDVA